MHIRVQLQLSLGFSMQDLEIDPQQIGQARLNLSSDILGTLEHTTVLI